MAEADRRSGKEASQIEHVEPWAVILVEGQSDLNAIEALAARMGRSLAAEGIAIVAMGGAHAIRRYLEHYGPRRNNLKLAGLYDAGEESVVADALIDAGILGGEPVMASDLESAGFHVCFEDLEDELIRALGYSGVEEVLASQGDLHSFRTLQKQPAWRGKSTESQLRRFMGSGATRKIRYARLLVETLALDDIPRPLTAVLERLSPSER